MVILAGVLVFRHYDLATFIQSGSLSVKPSKPTPLKSREFYEAAIPASPSSSVTQNISRDFFLNYVDLQNQGKWSIESQSTLIEKLSNTYATSTAPILKVSDVAVFSDRETTKTHVFANTVAATIKKYDASLKTSPIDILNGAVNGQNSTSTIKADLAPISNTYILLVNDLKKIPAPANLAATYVAVINEYSQLGAGVTDMSFYFDDSVRGFMGLTNYQVAYTNQYYLLKNMADYFKTNGILFSNTEEGRVWSSLSP